MGETRYSRERGQKALGASVKESPKSCDRKADRERQERTKTVETGVKRKTHLQGVEVWVLSYGGFEGRRQNSATKKKVLGYGGGVFKKKFKQA